ncbi:MAG TPA: KUP/HAK/KT family potassium transporter, partial [Burkholderiaceae bacterium]|nr:KUP/HAK/KT family potassium transporter [Burkholderiaceae bacterium]
MSEPSEVRADNRADRLRGETADEKAGRQGARDQARMALAALGVVYGDLGTSAIYALHAVFSSGAEPLAPTAVNVLGVMSLVFWTLIVVVSVKYMAFVLRADNGGEGGTFALIALLRPWRHLERRRRRALVLLGLAGASMLYAGIMITPAISILSAMEGLEIASPAMTRYVVPATVAILVA